MENQIHLFQTIRLPTKTLHEYLRDSNYYHELYFLMKSSCILFGWSCTHNYTPFLGPEERPSLVLLHYFYSCILACKSVEGDKYIFLE